jgi:Flp pilus assembly protein TadD
VAWHRRQAERFEAEGRWDAAVWHLGRGIEREPDGWELYHRRGRAHAALGRRDRAVADYTRAACRGADDPQVWLDRGIARAEAGRWDEAAADYARAVELGAEDDRTLSQHALLRLGVGDRAGYRKACARMLGRFGKTGNLRVANNVAWVCGYAPDPVADLSPVRRLAEHVAAHHPKRYATLNTLGAVLYRAGDYRAAVRTLNEAVEAHPQGGAGFDFLFLAMAHHRLDHPGDARAWLDRAARWVEQARQGKLADPSIRIPLSWIQRLELELLTREAEGLLKRAAP